MILDNIRDRVIYGRSGKPKVTRPQVMASRPIRNPAVKWSREAATDERPAVILLQIPRRRDGWGDIVARLMRLPDFRKLELDEIGSDVWEMCDGATTVDALTRAVCTQYRLNRRQGETSVTAYLQQLAERRLVALRTPQSPDNKTAAPKPKPGNAPKQKRA